MNKPCDSSTVWNMVESAKTKFFTTKSTSKTIKRDEVDLVFLIDATGGMAENGTFDKVRCSKWEGGGEALQFQKPVE